MMIAEAFNLRPFFVGCCLVDADARLCVNIVRRYVDSDRIANDANPRNGHVLFEWVIVCAPLYLKSIRALVAVHGDNPHV